jgi:uncharacterized membrane-anchored protein YhcB (DUF1043 family)
VEEVWLMWWVPIAVALISGPIMFMLHRLDRNNTAQHSQNMEVISEMRDDVREVKADVREVKADYRHLSSKVDTVASDLQKHVGGG